MDRSPWTSSRSASAVWARAGRFLAQDADAQSHEVTSEDGGWRMRRAVPMAQAIHHADDHRTHILSILGARGLHDPHLSVWAYARSAGLMQETPVSAEGSGRVLGP